MTVTLKISYGNLSGISDQVKAKTRPLICTLAEYVYSISHLDKNSAEVDIAPASSKVNRP